MIYGCGTDIVKIDRIRKNLGSDKFINKIYSINEINYLKERKYNPQSAAGMFSAKEAVSKVLGTGIRGFSFRDIEILKDELGKPVCILHNNARKIASKAGIGNIEISITHESEYAVAVAIGYKTNKFYYEYEDRENYYSSTKCKLLLKDRDKDTHKGTYGKVGIVAGSYGMTGASYLSSMSSLRTGSGLVYTVIPDRLLDIMSIKLTECVLKPVHSEYGYFDDTSIEEVLEAINKCNCIVLGPGIGTHDKTKEFVKEILLNYNNTIILDADGLNCIKDNIDILKNRKSKTIITPHEMEMKRLIEKTALDFENRVILAKDFSYNYNIVTVLKGHDTVVADSDKSFSINPTGNPGMATAGSGDVLTGIIASLVGQGLDAFDAARCGVYLHGLAGDIAKKQKGEYGLIASDILENIPYAISYVKKYGGSNI